MIFWGYLALFLSFGIGAAVLIIATPGKSR